jgi:hypothetical protein
MKIWNKILRDRLKKSSKNGNSNLLIPHWEVQSIINQIETLAETVGKRDGVKT